jgi:hypothetical protein
LNTFVRLSVKSFFDTCGAPPNIWKENSREF